MSATFDFTQWLDPDAREALAAAARSRRLPAGATIYAQGDAGDEMFRIVSGVVRLSVMQRDGRELLYQLFQPGDSFGTSTIVDEEPRPQTAEAYEDVELEVWSRRALDTVRRAHPSLNDALLRLLSRHMRLLSDYFAGFAFDELSCRLAQRIVGAIDMFGVAVPGGNGFSRPISQSELALMVGGTRQSVNRVLRDFKREKLVVTRGNALVVTDLPAMRRIAAQGWKLRRFDDAADEGKDD